MYLFLHVALIFAIVTEIIIKLKITLQLYFK